MSKVISFEKWLTDNYPDEVDNPRHGCLLCGGDGFFDVTMGEDGTCLRCMGSGSGRYQEYEEQYKLDQEKLEQWGKVHSHYCGFCEFRSKDSDYMNDVHIPKHTKGWPK